MFEPRPAVYPSRSTVPESSLGMKSPVVQRMDHKGSDELHRGIFNGFADYLI
jgi:hypothetical protein